MTPNDRCVCESCSWNGQRSDLLRAPNPFNPAKAIVGCPACKRVNTMRPTCHEPGCFDRPVFGEFVSAKGFGTHCLAHRPGNEGKSMKQIEPLVLKSRSSVPTAAKKV